MVCIYHAICLNPFLNVSVHEASGMEKVGNTLLVPFQYLFGGKEAFFYDDGSCSLVQKFNYDKGLGIKSAASVLALPASLVLGSTLKALSYLGEAPREHHNRLVSHLKLTEIESNVENYADMGIHAGLAASATWIHPQGHQRRPGDENHLAEAKECLRDIANVLNDAHIPWWVDCGTLLGAYRYGGIIPWDDDVDVALLLPDFENARRALNKLDIEKYMVQDWSGREFPDTFFKVYIRNSKDFVDIYFYDVDPEQQECSYIFALNKNIFFPEWFKIRERRFEKPIAFKHLFPLKKADFDGVEVFVPNDTATFLQRYYGENLDPAKIYDPITDRFEKDLSHPYWDRLYVH